ncbi:DEAD/DEAH box helicase [Nocardia rosealba]|uniref:DEAD/DEAH box helicase n=1 Tax=Nocardia rosealba TaxID=2878563 RepID=UPI001CD93F5C|nr:DEAD/DEAH box helicase family protein [Nocardia rosealba]MCA2206676.1 DEAD/DEAH box helicase family protein [Nocardia rosealba]
MNTAPWARQDPTLINLVSKYHTTCLEVYRKDPDRIAEDAGKERGIAEGGYGRKQIQELVQNAADALPEAGGRIEVVLTRDTLYVANEGHPFVGTGVRALLYTHLSNKTGGEIGRFGLGFKSISGISDGPQIFSQSISFEFSRTESAKQLAVETGRHFEPADVPSLRLARVLEPTIEFASDSILKELSLWAATIVKVPLKDGAAPQLSEEISEFDPSFNLFAPRVKQLRLRDELGNADRTISTRRTGKRVVLATEEGEQTWLVVSKLHHPSPEALDSAGYAARREAVPVSWAVPATGATGVGRLFAYFPVDSEVTLSGRLNAPWKLSDDRINVIECPFNYEILTEVVPELVDAARLELVQDGAYGRYIDVLPARGKESRSWADTVLNEPVMQRLRERRSIPTLDGELRSPSSVQMIPEPAMDWARSWMTVTTQRDAWVHPDCLTRERRAKVRRLMEENPRAEGRVLDWLHAAVADKTSKSSSVAIEIAAQMPTGVDAKFRENVASDVRDSRIVLLENGELQQPLPGRCFIRSDAAQKGTAFIDNEVTARPSTASALQALGITTFDDGGEMLQLLTDLRTKAKVDFDSLWIAMRGSGVDAVAEGFERILEGQAHRLVKVRNGKGAWVYPENLYIAAGILDDRKSDAQFLVDRSYHASDAEILGLLGVYSAPKQRTLENGARSEEWFVKYWKVATDVIGDAMGLGPRQREDLQIASRSSVLGPLQCLPALSETNRTALTYEVLRIVEAPLIRVSHPSVGKPGRFIAPELWWVREHGLLPTALGAVPVKQAFAPAVEELHPEIKGLLPVFSGVEVGDDIIERLQLSVDLETLTNDRFEWIVSKHVERKDQLMVGRAYAWWAYLKPDDAPELLWCRRAQGWVQLPVGEIAVATTSEKLREFLTFGIPCLQVDTAEDAMILRSNWGCLDHDLPVTYSYESSAEPSGLTELFDVFREDDLDTDPDDLVIQKCLSLNKVAAIAGRPEVRIAVEYGRDGDVLLVTGSNDREVLKQSLASLELDDSDEAVDARLMKLAERKNNKKLLKVRSAPNDAARLLEFAGEERLRALIPVDALNYLERNGEVSPQGVELAQLCIDMLGTKALERACRVDPSGLPISPPSRWSGSHTTRNWVRERGFSEEWAGQKAPLRNKPTEYIDGPAVLSELHDYQETVSKRLRGLIRGLDGSPRRGIISLPTGAGKTRVAVQTVIEAIAATKFGPDVAVRGPILWIADGEELCEQAIDTWSFLWRAKGLHDTQLILSRFWANYSVEEELGGIQVVVASWQKLLLNALDNSEFDWLADSTLVIVDEAHGATTRSYTSILNWAGRGVYERTRPLIGLTATPFRGRDDSAETQRLLNRFDNNLLDEGVFGDEVPQRRLQRDRVLARAQLEILHGVNIDLSTSELEQFRDRYWLPMDAARRLGQDEERTRKIVGSIIGKPKDWPIVVFAASVENAQTLATLLTLQGRPAASIDQDTSADDRRITIERFKNGDLKVLTNYNVLSQGFDAPKTRAVYITRPTSSKARYLQMVGRGMRGPKNGGSEEVLVVNVLDNIVEFGDSIAYESFERDVINSEED